MKKYFSLGLIAMLGLAVGLSGCGGGGKSSSSSSGSTSSYNAGDSCTCSVGNTRSAKTFKMIYVPAVSSFPTGTDDSDTGTVSTAYWLAETEVTYELWSKVYDWATAGTSGATGEGVYKFANAGASVGIYAPVSNINWRDAMVWCNALTEYYNATNSTSYVCVYTCNSEILRDATSTTYCDAAIAETNATGFRLPTSAEWELAARYIQDKNSDGNLSETGEYYPGSYASGADVSYSSNTASTDFDDNGYKWTISDVAVFDTHTYSSDSDGNYTYTSSLSARTDVKTKQPNYLNFYDMTGNVWEWCFDWYSDGTKRILRGGAWDSYCIVDGSSWSSTNLKSLQIGYINSTAPSNSTKTVGFRPARTQ